MPADSTRLRNTAHNREPLLMDFALQGGGRPRRVRLGRAGPAARRILAADRFNYTTSAQSRNAENVIVLWNQPASAAYDREWQRLWREADDYERRY